MKFPPILLGVSFIHSLTHTHTRALNKWCEFVVVAVANWIPLSRRLTSVVTNVTFPSKRSLTASTKQTHAAMLDLNLNADSASDLQMESSGSFNSSVVNAADTDDSCSYGDAVAYNFAILNNAATSDGLPLGAAGEPSVRTIQLFPAADSGASAAAWLDFSSKVDQHGAPPEQRITPRQQQVKKSRRGPRSRSSQYRGVTFYRRTGRWESHIWLVLSNRWCPVILVLTRYR